MTKNFRLLTLFALLLGVIAQSNSYAANPIKKDMGMADPHIYIFDGKAYLYSTHDVNPKAPKFDMRDWFVFSSDDLVNWEHLTTIKSKDNFMGDSNRCWATETVYVNGKYYFYFSNGNKSEGVMIADKPEGPYVDALGKPLLPSELTPGREYDATIIEDGGDYYILFGTHHQKSKTLNYRIARLNKDMISLAETPRDIEIIGKGVVFQHNDKPNLHKRNGLFYLSAGDHYSSSKSVYGPYTRMGTTSPEEKYGLDKRGHGNFFEKDNQWFHTWCHFHLGKENGRYRESYIGYVHYRANGEIVTDLDFLDKHFANGVGSYSAEWDMIEAEWFMKASREEIKRETKSGKFEVASVKSGDYVCYPYMRDLAKKREIILDVMSSSKGSIEVRVGDPKGKMIGEVAVSDTKGGYKELAGSIKAPKEDVDIYLVFKGSNIAVDNFRFK